MGTDAVFHAPQMLLASVIDLDLSFFIQLGLFLVLYILLSQFFFKPYAKILKKRDKSTEGLRSEANEIERRAMELEESAASRLEEARQAGNEERRRLAADGSRIRAELIAVERGRLQTHVERKVAELEKNRDAFRAASEPAVDEIAAAISRQVAFKGAQESK